MSTSKTHTEVQGARWPTVASLSQRLEWIAAILENENIEVQPVIDASLTKGRIAAALLRSVALCDITERDVRLAYFEAMMIVEEAENSAVAREARERY